MKVWKNLLREDGMCCISHTLLFLSLLSASPVEVFVKFSILLSQQSLSCRLAFVMLHYCVTANYCWLLVEGMYLYTLLVLSVFSKQRIFRLYLCIGWGKSISLSTLFLLLSLLHCFRTNGMGEEYYLSL